MAFLYTYNENFTRDELSDFEEEVAAISSLFNEQAS
jgi:hypothetical protein